MADRKSRSFKDKCFKDTDGNVVIFQSPNIPIIGWLVFTIVEKFSISDTVNDVSSLLAFGCLITWGWLELFSGVNYLRRFLGALVLVFAIMNRL